MIISHVIESIDTHTADNPTRNLVAGVPDNPGKSKQEIMLYVKENLRYIYTFMLKASQL